VCSHLLSKNLKIKIYTTINLPAVLDGCETLSLTQREEQRLRVFKKKMPRRIFEFKREEVAGGWRRLHSVELHNLYMLHQILLG
jgi:hypothetical protein